MNWLQLLSYHRIGQTPREIKGNEIRSEFERDYDRIIFSHPFRRLQDKTQVFPLPEHDFVHTRLTHSLEVSSVGRSLGKLAGEIILSKNTELVEAGYSKYDFGTIVASACLAHDLGNPPFGHSGEDAISEFFKKNNSIPLKEKTSDKEWNDLTKFEGNAQGFRILTKTYYQGLRLTASTLAAFTKYPRESKIGLVDKSRRSQKKYGFFQSEKGIFEDLAKTVGLNNLSRQDPGRSSDLIWCRHPLAFLVEAADDICYHIIDLEDGVRLGLVDFDYATNLLAQILGKTFDRPKFNLIRDQNEKMELLRALTINTLVYQAAQVFNENLEGCKQGTFDTALTDLLPSNDILKEIIDISVEKIYNARVVVETQAAGFEVIGGLLEIFSEAIIEKYHFSHLLSARNKNIMRMFPVKFLPEQGASEYQCVLSVIDFISGMTDTHAISLYRKIKGMNLPR
jgi:dGTPase